MSNHPLDHIEQDFGYPPDKTTRPAALATEQSWRAQAEQAPTFGPAVQRGERRLTRVQEALELAVITVAQLAAQRVEVLAVVLTRNGVPQIHVAAPDGERAYGDLATTVDVFLGPGTTRYVMVTGCIVHWGSGARPGTGVCA